MIYLASQVPDQPVAATTALETNVNVMIQWTAPFDNYMTIDRYQVLIGTHNSQTFIETKTLCDGSKAYVVSARTCIVPIASLLVAPYNLVELELIRIQVIAHNPRGWGVASPVNTAGVTAMTVPSQMTAPINGPLTDEYLIDVSWSTLAFPNNGGSDLTSFDLEYDNGTAGFIWYSLQGIHPESLNLWYKISTGVIPGRTYLFMVRAKNAFGWGPFSSTTTIKAATKPSQMVAPTTAIDVSGKLRISW